MLWLGQLVSTIGDQMQTIGIAWQLYLLTNSPLQLGLLGLFRAAPFMTLSLAGGALADAIDRKRLLILTQSSQMVLTAALVVATARGSAAEWLLYAVTFVSGAATAFDAPARQAMVPNLVPRRELGGALTLMTLMRQTAMIVGPGVGGLVIGHFGLAPNYLGNGLSFLAVIIAVLLLGPLPKVASVSTNNWERILGGLYFARRDPLVLLPMLLDFFTRAACSARSLLPIFARDVFAAGAEGLGWLNAAISAGAVVGGLLLGGSRQVKRPVVLIIVAYGVEGLFLVGFGLARPFAVALLLLFFKGVANVFGEVLRNTVLQLKTPDAIRGRVTALSGMFDSGGPQLGQLQAGALAEFIGPVGAAVWGGLAATAVTAGFLLFPGLRRGLAETGDSLAADMIHGT